MNDAAPLSSGNSRLKDLRRLTRRRSARTDAGVFVVEGPILVEEAVAAGADVRQVFVGVDVAEEHSWLFEAPDHVEVNTVRAGVLEKVLDPVTPRPVAAVVGVHEPDLLTLLEETTDTPLVLLLAGVSDPGNAGTLVRAAEASGACAVVFGEESVDAYSPKTVRASAGAILRVPCVRADPVVALSALSTNGLTGWAATQDDGLSIDEVDLTAPTVLVIGNEAHGVAPELLGLAAGRVSIPMVGRTESLNAAMAGTVLLFDAARQRRTTGSRLKTADE